MQAFISALEPVARITVATLFNSLWEAALLAFAVWLILRVLPNLNATTRYAAWCVALVGALLLPVATAIPQITVQHPSAPVTATSAEQPPATAAQPSHRSSTTIAKPAAAPAASASQNAAPTFKLPERLRFSLPEYVALGLFAAWMLAAMLMLVRLFVNLWRLEHLKRDALPLPVDYRERLSQWTLAEKGEREVRLCICDGIDVPVAVGLFDSMILIPQHLLDTLAPEEIDQIMLHELGHLRRADDWTNGLQRVIQALFFFNPAVLYIAQQLDLEREVACDDWVLHQTKNVRPYATCLTKMAEVTAWPHRALAAPGVFVTRRGLSVRVERLLRAGRNIRTSVSFGPAGAVVAALIVMFFVLQSVAPTFAFTLPEQTASGAKSQVIVFKHVEAKKAVTQVAVRSTALPKPQATDVVIPARHIHIPARTIPPINIDIPERKIHIVPPPVPPNVHNYLPANFNKQIQVQVHDAMRQSMEAVRQSMEATRLGMQAGAPALGKFNCVGCDYSRQNLAGRNFRGQRLSGADFSRANLQNADFSNSELVGADFSNANLRGVSFAHAVLSGCDLSHADLTGVNFDGVSMIGCDVDAKSLTPTQARSLIRACHTGCDFSGVNLSGQDLRGLSLVGIDLKGADLRGADLSGSRLSGVDLSNARMDGARFDNATLTGCTLEGVDLSKVDLSKARMAGDKLSRASTP
jgi:uncharacterized protein YjbI with pentapeptide repeats/beta-lactamase regulating signal transducer with metallopeptidase domain